MYSIYLEARGELQLGCFCLLGRLRLNRLVDDVHRSIEVIVVLLRCDDLHAQRRVQVHTSINGGLGPWFFKLAFPISTRI